jgi:hypothetical protein
MYLTAVCYISFLKYPYCLSSVVKWLKKWLYMIWGEFIVSIKKYLVLELPLHTALNRTEKNSKWVQTLSVQVHVGLF